MRGLIPPTYRGCVCVCVCDGPLGTVSMTLCVLTVQLLAVITLRNSITVAKHGSA